MREIKFRYVYKCKECGAVSARDYTLEQIEGMHIGFESVGSVQCSCDKFGRNFAELVDRLQYTGLKDKAGREIYEGDIVKPPWEWYNQVVSFGECSFGYEDQFTMTGWRAGTAELTSQWEVIGNVYESPELMEGKE